MIVLGVSGVFGHDAAACLLRDGELVAFVEEERLIRQKHAPGAFPIAATAYCLRMAGIRPEEVGVVAASWDPALDPSSDYLAAWLPRFLAHGVWRKHRPAVVYVAHHLAHAVSAAYFEGVNEAAILVVDGNGERSATTLGRLDASGFQVIEEYPVEQSLGHFYKRASFHVGLGQFGEGKVMGLAGYGRPDADVDLITTGPDGYTIHLDVPGDLPTLERLRRLAAAWDAWFLDRFGPPVAVEWTWNPDAGSLVAEAPGALERANVAAAVQAKLVDVLVHLARRATELARSRTLVLSGGVALNCGANGAIIDSGAVDDLVLFPACHDAGGALGAAAWAARLHGDRWARPTAGPYLAPLASQAGVADTIERLGLPFVRVDDPAVEAARLIAEGRVIARCRGPMEAGPRALGNRSILARADRVDVARRVNRIKAREAWRPFGPTLTAEAASVLLDGSVPSQYMLLFRSVASTAADRLAGATHVDGTTRPQTVTDRDNSELHRLLRAVGELTGTPAVLNTSFNVGPEPIVFTPQDAIRTFVTSRLDALFVDDLLLRKSR